MSLFISAPVALPKYLEINFICNTQVFLLLLFDQWISLSKEALSMVLYCLLGILTDVQDVIHKGSGQIMNGPWRTQTYAFSLSGHPRTSEPSCPHRKHTVGLDLWPWPTFCQNIHINIVVGGTVPCRRKTPWVSHKYVVVWPDEFVLPQTYTLWISRIL